MRSPEWAHQGDAISQFEGGIGYLPPVLACSPSQNGPNHPFAICEHLVQTAQRTEVPLRNLRTPGLDRPPQERHHPRPPPPSQESRLDPAPMTPLFTVVLTPHARVAYGAVEISTVSMSMWLTPHCPQQLWNSSQSPAFGASVVDPSSTRSPSTNTLKAPSNSSTT